MQDGRVGKDGRDGRPQPRDPSRERQRSERDRDGGKLDRDGRDGTRERDRYERDRERERARDGRGDRPPSRPPQHPQRSAGGGGSSRAAAGVPPRPQSRAAESEGRPVVGRGMPKRGSSNPLVAEAARLARERLASQEAAAGAGDNESDNDSAPKGGPPRRRAAWRDDEAGTPGTAAAGIAGGGPRGAAQPQSPASSAEEPEEGEMPAEPGELPPQQARQAQQEGAPAASDMPPGFGGEKGPEDAAGAGGSDNGGGHAGGKRKHEPIIWRTPDKVAKLDKAGGPGGGMPHAQSSSGIAGLGVAAGEGARPRTAAEIAQAELEAFAAAQAEQPGDGEHGRAYMKDSPELSSPEEEQHILREVTVPPPGAASDGDERGGGAATNGDGTPPTATAARKPASRWLNDDSEPAVLGPAPLAAAGAGASPPGRQQEPYPLSDDEMEAAAGPEGQAVAEAAEAEEEATKRAKREVSMLDECRSVDRYEKLNRINEGTYGVVYRARSRDTGDICALKKVKLEKERDGFPLTSVREINILLSLAHPNIVNVSEVVVGSSLDSVFMVMEYADHDLKAVMENRMTQPFSVAEVKCLLRQLLSGVAYLHSHWVLHRDLKTSNILYTNRGELKLCDFGLARQYGSPLKPYTHMVVTLWYRAIELLLGVKTYSTAVDIWSCGCIMAELLTREPLFPGKNEMEQISLIFKTLGTPTEETWPGLSKLPNYRRFNFASGHPNVLRKKFPPPGLVFNGRPALSDAGFDLLSRLLDYSPERRITADDALEHPWFREHPLPKDMALMPTFPATNDAVHSHPVAKRKPSAAGH